MAETLSKIAVFLGFLADCLLLGVFMSLRTVNERIVIFQGEIR